MKNQFLFPYKLKKPALVLLIVSLGFGFLILLFDNSPDFFNILVGEKLKDGQLVPKYLNIGDTLIGSLLILSSLIYAFSREKNEDEYLQKIRLDALVLATYINYGLLFIAFVTIWGFDFLSVLVFNLFTHLLLFIIIFTILKLKMNRSLKYEE